VVSNIHSNGWFNLLMEVHRPFAEAVRAGTGAIMCSYNQVNNSYGCQNSVGH
jgi:hypothetical protein